MLESIINWLESNYLACPYKLFFGIECLGCGMQRSFIALLKGNLAESFSLYPALLPLILMFLLLPIHLIFKLKKGADWLKYLFIFNISVIVISYIIKLIV